MKAWLMLFSALMMISVQGTAKADSSKAIIITEKNEEDKTIGELKPAYIDFKFRTSPRVSLNEVVLRYSRLIKEARDPEVRVKALHRLANLEDLFGSERPEGMIDDEVWKIAIESYENLLEQKPFEPGNDWILYQLARAYENLGNPDETREILERLVGQYPKSGLATESWFRIAESRYTSGNYTGAETAYRKVLNASNNQFFADKALYMLGWTQYKLDRSDEALLTFVSVLQQIEANRGQAESAEAVEADTLRIASLIASSGSGPQTLAQAIDARNAESLSVPLYKRLFEFYLANERFQDAARTADAYIQAYPTTPERLDFHVLKVSAYQQGRLPTQAWEEKERVVAGIGVGSDYWNARNTEQRGRLGALLYGYLEELGQRQYALAASRKGEARKNALTDASGYFDRMVALYPREKKSAQAAFLSGEANFQLKNWSDAIVSYEKAAYVYTDFDKRAEAAYAAVLAYGEALSVDPQDTELKRRRIDALLRFSRSFPQDSRTNRLKLLAASEEYDLERFQPAYSLAMEVTRDSVDQQELKSAWKLAGHAAFATNRFKAAEEAYDKAVALRNPDESDYSPLRESLAASIYSQGEEFERAGNLSAALAEYQRVITKTPDTTIRLNAQYDAAMRAIDLAAWDTAENLLTDFRQRFADHTLSDGVPEKLVYVHMQSGNKVRAADELNRIAATEPDPERQRLGRLQAADLYREAGKADKAMAEYRVYISSYQQPFDASMRVYQALVELSQETGQAKQVESWQQALINFEAKGGDERSAESRTLAAAASWELLQDEKQAFESLRLTLPLKKSLGRKQALLKSLLEQLSRTSAYGIGEYATAASHLMGQLYLQLGRDIIDSERPGNLSELEQEQYTLLLEEQAFPFEDKAIELLERNVSRTRQGVYDDWVKQSYAALSQLLPVRYNKQEEAADVPATLQ